MGTNIYYCKSCGRTILADSTDDFKLVHKVVDNGGFIHLDECVRHEHGIFLSSATFNGKYPANVSDTYWYDNEFTLNRDLFEIVKNNDDFCYVDNKSLNNFDKGYRDKWCPACGEALTVVDRNDMHKSGYAHLTMTRSDFFFNDLKAMKNRRFNWTIAERKKNAQDLIKRLEDEVDASAQMTNISGEVNLKEYLANLVSLETTIFGLTKRYEELLFVNSETENKAKRVKEHYENNIETILLNKKSKIEEEFQDIKDYIECKQRTIDFEKYGIIEPVKPEKPVEPNLQKPEQPVLEKPSFFNKAKVEKKNAEILEKYQCDLKTYEDEWNNYYKKTDSYNIQIQMYPTLLFQYQENVQRAIDKEKDLRSHDSESIDRFNSLKEELVKCDEQLNNLSVSVQEALMTEPKYLAFSMCENEMKDILSTLQKAIDCKVKFYKLGIIHPKYQNFTCVATFYDYLDTGRCSILTGADGAYNLYENELRQNLIIDKLETVIDSLETIKNNQYRLYSLIQKTNEHLSEISNKMDIALESLNVIENNTHVIAYNTAKTAYYSKVNAELTNSLGYMLALK